MTFIIYHGAAKPIRIRGKHCIRLAMFAEAHKGWHTFNTKCRNTRRALNSLICIGCVKIEGDQFMFQYPAQQGAT